VGIEGMQANKQIAGIVINGKLIDADSKTSNFVEVPDYPTRHKYWETLLKLKGRLKDKINDDLQFPDIKFDLYGNTIIQVNQSAT